MDLKITRDEFCRIMNETGARKTIEEAFEEFAELFQTDSYIFHWDIVNGGDVSIIEKFSLDSVPIVINWYKLYHTGRDLNIKGIRDMGQLMYNLNTIKDELDCKIALHKLRR